jgi:hypothetical protein
MKKTVIAFGMSLVLISGSAFAMMGGGGGGSIGSGSMNMGSMGD